MIFFLNKNELNKDHGVSSLNFLPLGLIFTARDRFSYLRDCTRRKKLNFTAHFVRDRRERKRKKFVVFN